MEQTDHSHHHAGIAENYPITLTEKINDTFSQYGFMPHGHCYLWKPLLVSIHVVSDILIGLAYFSISMTLYYLIKKIKLPFNRVVWSFGIFIGACGLTHFMEVWNLWNADYWWSAWVKLITAIASVATGIYLYRLRHPIINMAGLAKLAEERRIELETLHQNNIIEIARMKDEFATLANNISQLVWMADKDGNLFWYNNKWYDYTGTTPEEMLGWGWEKVQHPNEIERVKRTWIESLKTGTPWEQTIPLRSKDGSFRWFLSRALPVKDESGNILRWFGTNTDIEEQRNTQIKLEEATRDLNQSLKVRDEFLSIASHELKTPLTSLTIQAQQHLSLIRRNDPRAFDQARIIRNSEQSERLVKRLNRLVDDMLDVSRIKTGQFAVVKTMNDLLKTTELVMSRLENQFSAYGVDTPEIKVSGDTMAKYDPSRLEQVITNVFMNALKYGKGLPVEVKIAGHADHISLSITDLGIGIPPELQSRIFDRYERAVDANEVSGFGLGLFISKEIIDAHGGKITVESVSGKGSTFTVTIPRN